MNDLFYEIEYNSTPNNVSTSEKTLLKPQPITAIEKDPIRELFGEMREIARDLKERRRPAYDFSGLYRITSSNYSTLDYEIFYKQGMRMRNFTDNYFGNKEFNAYFPTYQMMGYEQLRTYFTWRTKVRSGNVLNTSLSYAFVYIYELLNNISVDNPQDGLEKLRTFWAAFRVFDTAVDKYVEKWLRDYQDYYGLQQQCDSTDSVYESSILEEWENISLYKISKSRFYTDGNEELIKEIFESVIFRLREQINLKELIFSPIKFERDPFKGAVFFNRQNKTVQMLRLFATDNGRQLVGDILRKIESCTRQYEKYKYKIKVNPHEFDEIIEQAVTDYYAELNRVTVEVDFNNLKQIRKEALKTQEKLIVEEELHEELPTISQTSESSMENAESVKSTFTEIELESLSILLRSENLKQFADKQGIMLEVLIDGINEKAMDFIGDNLIDDDYNLYDDYIVNVKELTEHGR